MAKSTTTRTTDRKSKAKPPLSKSMSKPTAKKTASAKSGGSKKASPASASEKTPQSSAAQISPEERERMIQYAAYHIAEKDGFKPGKENDYWRLAEEQILNLFQSQQNPQDSQADVH